MYTPSHNITNPEVEIVCVLTGESYVHIEGEEDSIIDPKLFEGGVDILPERFFRAPWVIKSHNGQMRVFGRLE